ncbi:MAG: hypothetical protein M9916_03615 [Crocinitomicaceae bacterium]|nr:hypothetical protein [Crocinitomicaceae bacterium]
MKYLLLLFLIGLISCSKVQNCECTTSWIDYTQYGPVTRYDVKSYPVSGNKKNAKTECDIIKTNTNLGDEYYTECKVK